VAKMSYLHGHNLHQDGEVGQVIAQTHGVAHVSARTHTALVGPHSLLGAGETQRRRRTVTAVMLSRVNTKRRR